MNARILISAVAALLIGAPGHAQPLPPAGTPQVRYEPLAHFGLAPGSRFPLESLKGPDGQPLAPERLLGKPVLVNVYTRHCPPCIKEVPKLNQVRDRNPALHVLAITPDRPAEVVRYQEQYRLTWPVAAEAGPLLTQFKVKTFPAFILLDTQGQLIASVLANQLSGEDGHATVEGIETWVATQLAARTP